MSFKVAFIGAGSIGFTRDLLRDLLSVPEFRDIEVAFTDINERNLDMVTRLCQRDIDANGLNIKIQATTGPPGGGARRPLRLCRGAGGRP